MDINVKRALFALVPSTSVAALALAAHAHYGEDGAIVGGGLAVATAVIGTKTSAPELWIGAGALAYGSFVTWMGFDPATAFAWVLASGASFAARLSYESKHKHDHLDHDIKIVTLQTKQIKYEVARMAIEGKVLQNSLPVLTGGSVAETELREAIYDLYNVQLLGAYFEFDEWGHRAVLHLPPELTRAKIQREWDDKVVNALGGTGKYRIKYGVAGNELVVRCLERDPLADIVDYVSEDLRDASEPIYLGPDEEGERTVLELLGKHMLILGSSGNGKSTLIQLLILRLVSAGAVCIGIDMKLGVELRPVRDLLLTLATNVDESRVVLEWLAEEVERRKTIMDEADVRKWTEDLGPYLWVFVDELSQLTMKMHNVQGQPTMAELLDERLRIDRAFGIHYVCATQAPSKAAFGGNTDQKTNYHYRISTRLEESGHAQFGFGPDWKREKWNPNEILKGPGELLIRSEDHPEPMRRKTMMITDQDLRAEVSRLAPEVVGIEQSPWGRGGEQLSPSQRVRAFLKAHENVTRVQIENGTGLEKKQVLDAIRKLGGEVARDAAANTYSLGPVELQGRIVRGVFPEILPGRSEAVGGGVDGVVDD